MSITVNLYYTGANGNVRRVAEQMERTGIAKRIRAEEGNLKYEYFEPIDNKETMNYEKIDIKGLNEINNNLNDNSNIYDINLSIKIFY